ncbi:hypothetical protein PM8797T_21213 [Gimesia maris DSM 8797]|nr:hypothetical protein PM8797T_21213 [Gimesia maris DSM 8797]
MIFVRWTFSGNIQQVIHRNRRLANL